MLLRNKPNWFRDPSASTFSGKYLDFLTLHYHIHRDTESVMLIRNNCEIAEREIAEIEAVEDADFERYHLLIMDGNTNETFKSLKERLPEQWKKWYTGLDPSRKLSLAVDINFLAQK